MGIEEIKLSFAEPEQLIIIVGDGLGRNLVTLRPWVCLKIIQNDFLIPKWVRDLDRIDTAPYCVKQSTLTRIDQIGDIIFIITSRLIQLFAGAVAKE